MQQRFRFVSLLADLATIGAFVLIVIGLINLSATLVKLQPEAVPVLSGFAAYEYVNDPFADDPEYLDKLDGPVVWLEGFVTNDGTALASGLALEVAIQEPVEDSYGQRRRPVTVLLVGKASEPNAYSPELATEIPWANFGSLLPYQLADMQAWSRLYLPPVPPGSYVQVLIGLPASCCKELTLVKVRESIQNGVTVRLVHLTKPTFARSSYGKQIPGEPDVISESHLQFTNVYLDWHGV